jgi:hypothetical protein
MANDLKVLTSQAGGSNTKKDFQLDPKLDMTATWVKAVASDQINVHFGLPVLSELFRRVASELKKAGFDVIEDINTEPLQDFSILSCFEVYHKPKDGARNPEELGIVSLYSKEGAPAIFKLSPWASGSSAELLGALARATESLIESLPASVNQSNFQIQVFTGHSPSFE